jgi:hypothetical protein
MKRTLTFLMSFLGLQAISDEQIYLFSVFYELKFFIFFMSGHNTYSQIFYAMQCWEKKLSENTKEREKIYAARDFSDKYDFALFKYQIKFVKLLTISF